MFLNVIFDTIRTNSDILLLIAILLMIPGIVFQLAYEEKFPSSANRKKIGWIISVPIFILALFADKILNFISELI